MGRPYNAPKALPDAEILRAMFIYDSVSGSLKWAEKPDDAPRARWWNSVIAGNPAGSPHSSSKYLRVMIDGAHFLVHRVIWKIETGNDAEFIDHVNGDGFDNRFVNLRDVSCDENLRNKPQYKNNSSGVTGVIYHKRDKAWMASVGISGKQIHLGSYKTKEEATAAALAARLVLGFHPNHGRK